MVQRVALLTNPTAGRGRGVRTAQQATPRLRDAGFEVEHLQGSDADEATELAHDCVQRGVETLVVVGGDGLVHRAVQALVGSATRLGLLPTGTGNDVARYLGVPRGDTDAAVDVVVGGRERTIDLARAGVRYFVTVLAAGFDAVVNERANAMARPRGQMRYNLATLLELRTLRPVDYVLELDGVEQRLAATVVAVGNGPSFGGGLRITEGAELDDGLLDVVVIDPMSRRELVRTYPRLFRGTHVRHPGYHHHRVRTVTVAAAGVTAYADGERVGPLPLTVDVVPAALRVLVGR